MNDKLIDYANFEKSISEARTAKQAYERFFEKDPEFMRFVRENSLYFIIYS